MKNKLINAAQDLETKFHGLLGKKPFAAEQAKLCRLKNILFQRYGVHITAKIARFGVKIEFTTKQVERPLDIYRRLNKIHTPTV